MRTAIIVLSALATLASVRAQPSPFAWKSIQFPDGQRLEFRAHLTPGFDRAKPHPVAMVFVDGAQDRAAVWDTLAGYWFREASEHGWVVVLPVAPKAGRFHEGGESLLPALIRNLRVGLTIEGNRLHAVGVGEGAKSAFRVVENAPFEFASLTAFGDPTPGAEGLRRLGRLATVRVSLFGPPEGDEAQKDTSPLLEMLTEKDVDARWTAMPEYDNAAIWRALRDHRDRLTPPDSTTSTINAAIDAWHDAAAKGDEHRYFGAFAPEGVFMGTDATERWTVDSFRKWAMQYFERPSAWIFVPVSRNLILSPKGDVAWFDEVLGSAHYGECRGTGVLREIEGVWKIAHYNLTVPVPNDLLGDVVNEIRGLRDALERGESAKEAARPVTLYIVAAAEAGEERAAALVKLLRPAGVSAVLASASKSAQINAFDRLLPHQKIEILEGSVEQGLAPRLRALQPGSTALVAVAPDELSDLLRALRIGEETHLADQAAADLFVVTLDAAGRAHLKRLDYGQ